MQRVIVGLLVLALVGAGATVWLVSNYIDRRVQATSKKIDTARSSTLVLVAKVDVPIGKKIARSDVDWLAWPENGIQGNFISSTRRDGQKEGLVIGSVARLRIFKGTPMTKEAVFKPNAAGFLAGVLAPDMRAVSIAVTPESGASGFIMPGDRVDVILMQDVKRNLTEKNAGRDVGFKPYSRFTAETVLHNLRVLAADQKVDEFENKKAQVSKTVTVEVTQKQAEALTVAKAMGKLGLALRSFVDNQTPEASEESLPAGGAMVADRRQQAATTTTDLEISPILAGSVATASGQGAAPRPVIARRQNSSSPVKIYRGGQPSTVNF